MKTDMKTIEINDVKVKLVFEDGYPDDPSISITTGDGKPVVMFDDSVDGKGFMTEEDYDAHFTDLNLNGHDWHACFSYEMLTPSNYEKNEWEAYANEFLEEFGAMLGEYHDTDNGGYYDLRRI